MFNYQRVMGYPTLFFKDQTGMTTTTPWKNRVRRARQRHILQESIMLEAQHWHQKIFRLLRSNAATFCPDPLHLRIQDGHVPCPDCSRTFTTPQGVHVHRRKIHGQNIACWTRQLALLA